MRDQSDDPVSSLNSIGQELREERERKGKQLNDVWLGLEIRPEYLVAIEEGRFEELPSLANTIAYVSPVKTVGQELREERERQGKQINDVWLGLKNSPGVLGRD